MNNLYEINMIRWNNVWIKIIIKSIDRHEQENISHIRKPNGVIEA